MKKIEKLLRKKTKNILGLKEVVSLVTLFALLFSISGVNSVFASHAYFITLDTTTYPIVNDLTVEIGGNASADQYVGNLNQQNVSIDWDEDGDEIANNWVAANSFTVFQDGGKTKWFDATWYGSHTYSTPGDYTIFARVHHQNVNGAEGSDVATVEINITVSPPNCTDADQDNYYLEGQTCGTEADCDDSNPDVNPGATEVCNGVDDDCDGEVDEGVKTTFYQDSDNDGYGNPQVTTQQCFAPDGYVADNTDCDDTDATIYPGATEVCGDGIDQDCDGSDLPCPGPDCTDNDGDGYAIEGDQCGDIDCNDSDPTIHPGATEICGDGIDQDCDGSDAVCPEVTINAYKIVCASEADLPNWGNRDVATQITGTTASDYVAQHPNCQLFSDWSFEWAYAGTANPGDNIIGPAGGDWTTFGPTDSNGEAVTTIDSLSGDRIWVREVMQEGYIPFSGDTTAPRDNNVSAELYCHQDVLNYDNYDYILNPQWDNIYYCVAFNVPIEEPTHQCSDGIDNDQDGLIDYPEDPGCSGPEDDDEYNEPEPSVCGNGVKEGEEECDGTDGVTSGENFCTVNCELVPIYDGLHNCPEGTVKSEDPIWSGTISGTDADGEFINGISGQLLFEASESFVPTSAANWYADAGYSTDDNWSSWLAEYGIQGTGENYAAHALLSDMGTGEVSVVDWGEYNPDHIYTKYYNIEAGNGIQFVIGDRYSNWFDTKWDNQAGMNDNSGHLTLDVYECVTEEPQECTPGEEEPCDTGQSGVCSAGTRTCDLSGSWGECIQNQEPSDEICDGLDNDCDGEVDEGGVCVAPSTWYRDADGDGYGDPEESKSSVEQPEGYVADNTDCDDEDEDVHPGATEICGNGIDEDCDGEDDVCPVYTRSGGGFLPTQPEGEVLGEEIVVEEPCGIYLYEHIKYGANNNPAEVIKLQNFLNDYLGLNLALTGVYDLATMNAVNEFQVQCKEEVLKPWVDAGVHCDVNEPTGYVYKTTKRWINLIMCPTLNIPMPDLSGYPKADCTAVLGGEVLPEENGTSDDTVEETGETEEGEEGETGEEEPPAEEEVTPPETETEEAETEEGGMSNLWLIVIVVLAVAVLIWLIYRTMKK